MRLRRVDCAGPGLTRRRAGRGFGYLDRRGRRITDTETLARIRALAIPPAWTDVWVCPDPLGHLQATGVDAAGRRQYLYHDEWRVRRDREKFDHMLEFAAALRRLRRTVHKHLARPELDRERVLACAVRLLDLGFFRIGTEGYAESNQSYGLATIRRDHVAVRGETVTFDYVAKSGKQRIQSIVDPHVLDVVRALKRRRAGDGELLAYKRDGVWVDVRSGDINDYIKEITGGEFSAKDFRTWNATVLGAIALAVSHTAPTGVGRKRAVARAMSEVAHYLGNTPAVCRASYVDPRIVDRYYAGRTVRDALERFGADPSAALGTHGAVEDAVLELLTDDPALAEAG